MEITFIQGVLIFVVAFIMGIDQFSFLESLYQPVVLGPIMGAILGNFELGIVVGGAYQLVQIGSMPIGGAQPPNAIMGTIMTAAFAVSLGLPPTPDGVGLAVGLAIPFAVFGQYAVTITFTAMAGLMSKAMDYAEEANTKGIARINYLEMAVLGTLFGILAVAGVLGASALGDTLREFSFQWSWLFAGLDVAGGAMKFVGFAILMKIMMSNEMWGFLFAGFVIANICAAVPAIANSTLLMVALIGFGVALYDYQINTKIKANAGSNGGDFSDGI